MAIFRIFCVIYKNCRTDEVRQSKVNPYENGERCSVQADIHSIDSY